MNTLKDLNTDYRDKVAKHVLDVLGPTFHVDNIVMEGPLFYIKAIEYSDSGLIEITLEEEMAYIENHTDTEITAIVNSLTIAGYEIMKWRM